MGIYRIFAGSDGESHMEEPRVEEHPELGALTTINEVRVQQFDGTRKRDFHPLPERRLIIHLSGDVEIGTSDGSRHVFRAGDIRLMEDVTGRGHTHVDRSPSSAVYVLLKDEDGGESRARAHAVLGMRRLTERGLSRRDRRKAEPPLTTNPQQSLGRCRRPWLRGSRRKRCTMTWTLEGMSAAGGG